MTAEIILIRSALTFFQNSRLLNVDRLGLIRILNNVLLYSSFSSISNGSSKVWVAAWVTDFNVLKCSLGFCSTFATLISDVFNGSALSDALIDSGSAHPFSSFPTDCILDIEACIHL